MQGSIRLRTKRQLRRRADHERQDDVGGVVGTAHVLQVLDELVLLGLLVLVENRGNRLDYRNLIIAYHVRGTAI